MDAGEMHGKVIGDDENSEILGRARNDPSIENHQTISDRKSNYSRTTREWLEGKEHDPRLATFEEIGRTSIQFFSNRVVTREVNNLN